MAQRRMFSKTVVQSENFISLSHSAQALYLQLGVEADDDGFMGGYTRPMRGIAVTEKELQELIEGGFLYKFDSGVIVIRHWFVSNQIQKDRRHPTDFQKELSRLAKDKNGVYILASTPVSNLDTECIQNGSNLDTQVSIGKVSIGQDRLGEAREGEASPGEAREGEESAGEERAREGNQHAPISNVENPVTNIENPVYGGRNGKTISEAMKCGEFQLPTMGAVELYGLDNNCKVYYKDFIEALKSGKCDSAASWQEAQKEFYEACIDKKK